MWTWSLVEDVEVEHLFIIVIQWGAEGRGYRGLLDIIPVSQGLVVRSLELWKYIQNCGLHHTSSRIGRP